MNEARQRRWAGWAALAAGLFTAWMVWRHPEGLRAPAFVAYAAAGAFALAGLSLVAGPRLRKVLQAWMAVALVLLLLTPPVWIAFGPGERRCSVSLAHGILQVFGIASESACRLAFGASAVLGLAILVLFVRQAVRAQRS